MFIVPLPAGTEPDHEHLSRLIGAERTAAYETHGNTMVIYGDQVVAGMSLDLTLSLLAIFSGTYTAPAARTYAYYADQRKWWCAPLTLKVAAP